MEEKSFHTKTHTETHTENHTENHTAGDTASDTEELKALLGYMIHHNEHHEEELSGYAQVAAGRSKVLIEEAISLFKEGNDKLKQALALMEEE